MLDSIISRDQYGNVSEGVEQSQDPLSVEETIRQQLGDMEERIADTIEAKVRTLSSSRSEDPAVLQDTLESIRPEIKTLTDNAASSVASYISLPSALQKALIQRKDFHAHYVLLAAISKEGVHSIDELKRVQHKYNISEPLESGLDNLLESPILEGSKDNFHIATEFSAFGCMDRQELGAHQEVSRPLW
jgi:hypothetical protein